MMSPPRSHPASFAPHGTPPAGCGNMSRMMNSNNMSTFNENNNNALCNNHNTAGQQNFYHPNNPQSQQQQHPNMPTFQRSCSMSNVIGPGTGQPSQFVFLDDCSTIELYDFKLSTAGATYKNLLKDDTTLGGDFSVSFIAISLPGNANSSLVGAGNFSSLSPSKLERDKERRTFSTSLEPMFLKGFLPPLVKCKLLDSVTSAVLMLLAFLIISVV
ncbi:hypothetical protein DdX_05881 [Ditylenchus destructor]|uniref:Uncharacterized protein n=1 Tax=Ditylenchus destructor TaxID=166010 RepID=A0AAD4NBH3_9BILA|nr:hypothetical protein DdX_05881 [Ditylenchus destructor]